MNTDNNDFYDDDLSRSLINNDFEDNSPRRKKKSKKPLIICLIILLIAATAGGVAWYLNERHKPVEATEKFLTGMQNMDFTTMENLLQSHDLSALDDADIRDSAYTDFFTTINKKMTYKITKNKFDIQNGTANVTVHMKYIDGTNIYAATIQEYTRKVAVAAYAGKTMTQDDIQEMLASLLTENASTADEKYSDIDITYPLIKIGDEWKIVSLDDTTVKVMCANFKNVKDEISSQLNDDSSDSSSDASADSTEPSDTSDSAQTAGSSIDITTDKFSVRFKQFAVSKDYGGNSCLMIYYDYTNSGDSQSSAFVDFTLQASQNGESLEGTYPEANDTAVDNYMNTIDPGKTVTVCQVFLLKDTTSDVTLQGKETLNVSGGQTTSQVLKLQ
ncbi:DUF5067 domain-containing protein [Blautia schinkii]|uniref:DUF5067 domain-containing protein n=1 Tax=Blautia schinkii TaxID=180164 RepID=UPI001FC7C2CF|nr:DUF5067 domain-containing protein [Blautia schinkii]